MGPRALKGLCVCVRACVRVNVRVQSLCSRKRELVFDCVLHLMNIGDIAPLMNIGDIAPSS